MRVIRGYKVFNPDWTCRGFQYEVGKTYEADLPIILCESGFHFCKRAVDCFNYYKFDPQNKVAEIIAHGGIVENNENGDTKCVTDKIEIVREIPWTEVLELVNTGKANTGFCNAGDRNAGDCNTGNCNTGNWNTGDWNTGDRNAGNCNTGDWNKTSFVAGCFNTEKHKLMFFDEPTDTTLNDWQNSQACSIMNRVDFYPVEWTHENEMSDEEKNQHPEYQTTGGYLKTRDTAECFRKWWDALTLSEKRIVKSIPNFNPEKFKLITGIEVEVI